MTVMGGIPDVHNEKVQKKLHKTYTTFEVTATSKYMKLKEYGSFESSSVQRKTKKKTQAFRSQKIATLLKKK